VTSLRCVCLALAAWSAAHPMLFVPESMRDSGPGLVGVIDAWYVNGSTTGLTWNLTIAAIALTVWLLAETISRKARTHVITIPVTFCTGVNCGLPLYLFLRFGRHDEAKAAAP
jgi:hypothetical protein